MQACITEYYDQTELTPTAVKLTTVHSPDLFDPEDHTTYFWPGFWPGGHTFDGHSFFQQFHIAVLLLVNIPVKIGVKWTLPGNSVTGELVGNTQVIIIIIINNSYKALFFNHS